MAGAPKSGRMPIPRTVWALGFVSMFIDISLEIIHALLPLFLTATLGVSVAMVGLIDGVVEATASISKVFSGYLSDRMGKRKPLILIGYGIGALSKPLFALAGTAPVIMGFAVAGATLNLYSQIGVVIVFGVSLATLITLVLIPILYTKLARFTGSPDAVGRQLESQLSDEASNKA